METTELLKKVQRVALECMIGKKPVQKTKKCNNPTCR